ncbi:sugar O-acetyltransferase [Nocardioides marmoriginsengisoli]|uniref:Sugar O-acetyltransferase n=1 Tax=Nocardioides marmoriginsengisoli TaxID=661483 RepID=A0A3N0CJY6_9ACTN|nr:sugar O-acetyltransferase [Nocardioides marmoriginsengisoli]RNL63752.1 sugar O-acetyltransferase [Nocardioides marmoriginsengisoli]
MTTEDRTARQKMLAGEPYFADDPELIAASLRARRLTAEYDAVAPGDRERAREVLVELLGSVGDEVSIRPPLYVDYGSQVTVGDRVFANYGLTALDCARITIGDDTQIGPHVQLLTPTHPLDADQRRTKVEAAGPITIGANVWLGGGVIVLAGVTIGDNAVVGAGSVVTGDIPANTVAVGNPARVIRKL